MNSPKNIIIRRSEAIGDVLLATSILPSIIAKYSGQADITFVTNKPQVLIGNPYIKKVASSIPQLNKDDIFIDLDLAYELRPQISVFEAYANAAEVDPESLLLTYSITEEYREKASFLLAQNGVNPSKAITIQSGSNSWVRNIKPSAFEAIIGYFKSRKDLSFVLLGSRSDPYINGTVDLRNIGPIGLSAAIINESIGFIGIDSTLIHFAKALNKPVAAFFGPTDPHLRLKINDHDLIFISPVPCRFCHHKIKPPAFITLCKNDYISLLIDSIWLSFHRSKNQFVKNFCTRVIRKLQNWRDNGRRTPICMNFDFSSVTSKMELWLDSLPLQNIKNH
jgi:ADP-heptose:LPS heptosyltransferase